MPGNLVCFSHLRWEFVFQRPQHLMSRAAAARQVTYWEEPVQTDGPPGLDIRRTAEGVTVVQPRLPGDDPATERALLDGYLAADAVTDPVLWYYTPRAMAFSGHLVGRPVVYDCMDELAAFQGADPALGRWEDALMTRADLVFTGGQSLYEARKDRHPAVHAFPSGVDVSHFRPARGTLPDVPELAGIPHPRAGFYGVLDERLDRDLLGAVAALRPDVQFVIVGPTVKIDPATLPAAPNLHYPGAATYGELPALLAHWEVALMPFAMNEATRFISPTKTPEYLAAGRPVVSTPIADVVRRYRPECGVHVAATPEAFAAAIDAAMATPPATWLPAADRLLDGMGWDGIWARMAAMIEEASHPCAP